MDAKVREVFGSLEKAISRYFSFVENGTELCESLLKFQERSDVFQPGNLSALEMFPSLPLGIAVSNHASIETILLSLHRCVYVFSLCKRLTRSAEDTVRRKSMRTALAAVHVSLDAVKRTVLGDPTDSLSVAVLLLVDRSASVIEHDFERKSTTLESVALEDVATLGRLRQAWQDSCLEFRAECTCTEMSLAQIAHCFSL
jgi:hypothetical protein